MEKREFVQAIIDTVQKSVVENIKTELDTLPDTYPGLDTILLHKFYQKIDEGDKSVIEILINKSVRSALFGFFCVLDGVRNIEDGENAGELVLNYVKDDETINLNDLCKGDFLHDIYKELNDDSFV